MKTEEIIERLRNPQKYSPQPVKHPSTDLADTASHSTNRSSKLINSLIFIFAGCVIVGILITWMFVLHAKKRAENITAALDPQQVKGLHYETEFNPNKGVTYVQVTEGTDRNVAVDTLGTTLPIISRFNYQAITPKNYGVIGMAPWALTENLAANLKDPDLVQYLFNRKEVGEAFISRADVAPLLEDPQLLAAFAQDNQTLNNFFSSPIIQEILENEKMVRAIGNSRFMNYLLISQSAKYYRENPQEAVKLIEASPALSALRSNRNVQQVVRENRYLQPIALQLLGTNTNSTSQNRLVRER